MRGSGRAMGRGSWKGGLSQPGLTMVQSKLFELLDCRSFRPFQWIDNFCTIIRRTTCVCEYIYSILYVNWSFFLYDWLYNLILPILSVVAKLNQDNLYDFELLALLFFLLVWLSFLLFHRKFKITLC